MSSKLTYFSTSVVLTMGSTLTRQREYHMRGFSSATQAQRFLTLHRLTHNLFRLGRHLMQEVNYRLLRMQAFRVCQNVVCA
jgi:hypothetical protein